MKKIVLICVVLSLLFICGCKNNETSNTNPVDATGAIQGVTTGDNLPTETEGNSGNQPNNNSEFETPIDVDDSFVEQEDVTEPSTTPTDPTEPGEPSQPVGTVDPTEPTQPVDPTEPTTNPTEGNGNQGGLSDSGAIELPMIPG